MPDIDARTATKSGENVEWERYYENSGVSGKFAQLSKRERRTVIIITPISPRNVDSSSANRRWWCEDARDHNDAIVDEVSNNPLTDNFWLCRNTASNNMISTTDGGKLPKLACTRSDDILWTIEYV